MPGPRTQASKIYFVLLLSAILAGSAYFVYAFISSLPALQDEEREILFKFPPKKLSDLVAQRAVLLGYARTNPVSVFTALCLLYIVMQTFAIPGTLSLSILSGALYGTFKGLMLVSVVCTVGATSCFMLSRKFGRSLSSALWPDKVERFSSEVNKRRNAMFNYIVFLRVTPILPNTFINVVSPVVHVPLLPFITGTFFGCMPNNFVAVSAGNRLGELNSLSELYDSRMILFGLAVGAIAMLPVFLRRQIGQTALQ